MYYRKLNGIIKPFPIPWCDDTIVIIGGVYNEIWIISLDAHQGCHQVAVKNQSERNYPSS